MGEREPAAPVPFGNGLLELHKQCVNLRMTERSIHEKAIVEGYRPGKFSVPDLLNALNVMSYHEDRMCSFAGCTNLSACVAPVHCDMQHMHRYTTTYCTAHAFKSELVCRTMLTVRRWG